MMRPLLMTAPSRQVIACLDADPAAGDAIAAEPVSQAAKLPATVEFLPAAPNPLSSSTLLRFSLPSAATVDLRVFDVQGKQVRVLSTGSFGAGEHHLTWGGNDEGGRAVAPGVYFLRMQAAGLTRTQRVVLIP